MLCGPQEASMANTVFTQVDYTLGPLIDSIHVGIIGLPDIQRPFVWSNALVRNLFDSMYRGFPIGNVLFWKNANVEANRSIGTNQKQKVPDLLVVDGQQRLTSLYAVMKGVPVLREDYSSESIEIAFSPLTEKFEVADAAIRNDKTFIPNISSIWSSDIFDLAEGYLHSLSQVRKITQDERRQIRKGLSRLQSLVSFPITAIELLAATDEEQVAEIFVRINSEGKKLNTTDFILTLLSVFWDDGRLQLESFARNSRTPARDGSPFNHLIEPTPDQMLRVCVALAFRRAQLKHVYSILRGKDLKTERFSAAERDRQFDLLKQAQQRALNLSHWHDFLRCISLTGYRSADLISSRNSIIFTYTLYLIGRTEYQVDEYRLRKIIAQWFFMTALTGRYTGAGEGRMESDLAKLSGEKRSPDEFVSTLQQICDSVLTDSYWGNRLPNDLATASANSPAMYAYFAALISLDAKALFSRHSVAEFFDPAARTNNPALDRHALFPKGYLKTIGLTEIRDTNQNANFALMEWDQGFDIRTAPPVKYVPDVSCKFAPAELAQMHFWHALPDDWANLRYRDFLRQRRGLIAKVIRAGYRRLADQPAPRDQSSISELIRRGEGAMIEFKSSLRVNLQTQKKDPEIEKAVLKTLAAFLNARGGTLLVGVDDSGKPLGVQADGFSSEDRMQLFLGELIKTRLGAPAAIYIHPRFESFDGARLMVVECAPAQAPVYVKDGANERFYIRNGASTLDLSGPESIKYWNERFQRI
jgi:hypothetical protein